MSFRALLRCVGRISNSAGPLDFRRGLSEYAAGRGYSACPRRHLSFATAVGPLGGQHSHNYHRDGSGNEGSSSEGAPAPAPAQSQPPVDGEALSSNCFSPVDGISALLDSLHQSTGFPWWISISLCALIMRVALLPLKIIELKNLARVKSLAPKLQLQALVQGTLRGNFHEEYRRFKSRKRELNSPGLFWMFNPGAFVQLPLFWATIYTLRKLAVEQHSGFSTGGTLWFVDLTASGQGVTGTFLPFVAAAAYFANVHVSLQGHPAMQGVFGVLEKAWKTFLRLSPVLVFTSLYHFPQAVLMFSVPHCIMTCGQTLLLNQPRFMAFLVGSEAAKILGKPRQTAAEGKDDSLSSYEKLLKDAGASFSSGDNTKAICILESAIAAEPDKEHAYALLGWVYNQREDWVNSAIYYQHAILKGTTDEFKIASYAAGGLALLNQGKTTKCIELLRAIREYEVPTNIHARHSYCSCLFILIKALAKEGLEDESKQVLKQLKETQSHGSSARTTRSS